MIAAMKNRTRPVAAAIPTAGTPMPMSNPSAPAAFKIPSVVIHELRHADFRHVAEDRRVTDEIERSRENNGRGREYCDNDVSNKHGTLRWLFRDPDDFVDVFMLLDRVEYECRNCFARKREAHFRRSAIATPVN